MIFVKLSMVNWGLLTELLKFQTRKRLVYVYVILLRYPASPGIEEQFDFIIEFIVILIMCSYSTIVGTLICAALSVLQSFVVHSILGLATW